MDDPDPFTVPSAPLLPPGTVAAPAPRPRWAALRVIPMVLCGVVILLCGLQVVITTVAVLAEAPTTGNQAPGPTFTFALASIVAQLAMIALGVVATRHSRTCRWPTAIPLTVALIVAYGLFVKMVT